MKLFKIDALEGHEVGQQFSVVAPDEQSAIRLAANYRQDRHYTAFRCSGVNDEEDVPGPERVIGPSGTSESAGP
ncbi:MAG TPA: hypothetical protein VGD08_22670 [Stellaceae bacterium]|jgi:hypothetical protein